jgi:hypothetical protein
VDQVALLLEGLNLGDYVTPFRAAGVNGDTLQFCHTREDLKEVKGVDIPNAWFRKLRAAVEGYAPTGVPTALLEEAQGRVRQREQEAADAALAQRLHQEQAEAERQRLQREAERDAERSRLAEEARVKEEAAARAEREAEEQRQAKLREREATIRRLKPQAPAKVLDHFESLHL